MRAVRPPRRLHCHAPNAFCAGLAVLQLAQTSLWEVKSSAVRYQSTATAEPHATRTLQPATDSPMKITRQPFSIEQQNGKQKRSNGNAKGDNNKQPGEGYWGFAKRILREGLVRRRKKATQGVKARGAVYRSSAAQADVYNDSKDSELVERLMFHKDELMSAYRRTYKDDLKNTYRNGYIQATPPIDGFKTIWKPHMTALRDLIRERPGYFRSLSQEEAKQVPFLLYYLGHSIGPEPNQNGVRLPLPWKVENSDSLLSGELLEGEFRRFLTYMELSSAEKAARQAVLEDMRAAIPSALGEDERSPWTLEPFGSEVTGLALPGSDLDVRLVKPGSQRYRNDIVLAKLVDYLSSTGEYLVINMRSSRHAIAVLQHRRSGIEIQMVFANARPQQEITAQLLSESPELHNMYVLLRAMLKVRDLGEVYTGGLGSYATLCLAAAALRAPENRSAGKRGALAILDLLAWLGKLNTKAMGVQVTSTPIQWNKQKLREQYPLITNASGLTHTTRRGHAELAFCPESVVRGESSSNEAHVPVAFGDDSSPLAPEVTSTADATSTELSSALEPTDHVAEDNLLHRETESTEGLATDLSQFHNHDIRDHNTSPSALKAALIEPESLQDVMNETSDHVAGADWSLTDTRESTLDSREDFGGDAEPTSWLDASESTAQTTGAGNGGATEPTDRHAANSTDTAKKKISMEARSSGKAYMLKRHETRPWMLTLQDPADPLNDLGAHTFAIKHILATARYYETELRRDMEAHDEAHHSERPSPIRSLLLPLVGSYHEHLYDLRERASAYGNWVLGGRKGDPPPLSAPVSPVHPNGPLIKKVDARANWSPGFRDLDLSTPHSDASTPPAAEVSKPDFGGKKPESDSSKFDDGWTL